jgi:hypothetical protein
MIRRNIGLSGNDRNSERHQHKFTNQLALQKANLRPEHRALNLLTASIFPCTQKYYTDHRNQPDNKRNKSNLGIPPRTRASQIVEEKGYTRITRAPEESIELTHKSAKAHLDLTSGVRNSEFARLE